MSEACNMQNHKTQGKRWVGQKGPIQATAAISLGRMYSGASSGSRLTIGSCLPSPQGLIRSSYFSSSFTSLMIQGCSGLLTFFLKFRMGNYPDSLYFFRISRAVVNLILSFLETLDKDRPYSLTIWTRRFLFFINSCLHRVKSSDKTLWKTDLSLETSFLPLQNYYIDPTLNLRSLKPSSLPAPLSSKASHPFLLSLAPFSIVFFEYFLENHLFKHFSQISEEIIISIAAYEICYEARCLSCLISQPPSSSQHHVHRNSLLLQDLVPSQKEHSPSIDSQLDEYQGGSSGKFGLRGRELVIKGK